MDKKLELIVSFLCFLTFILIPASGSSEGKKEYRCVRLTKEPVLDGRIREDTAWADIPEAGDRFIDLKNKKPVSKQTYFRMGYTSQSLFIGVRCEEPDIERIKAELGDTGPLWTEDSVEIFIQPAGRQEYFQFIVNAVGSRYNDTGVRDIGSMFEAQAHVGRDYWSIEVKISLKVFKAVPVKGEKWAINICRNILSGGPSHTTWAYLDGVYHEPKNFGKMLFADPPSRQEGAKAIKQKKTTLKAEEKSEQSLEETFLFSTPFSGTYLCTFGEVPRRINFVHGPYVAPRLSPDGKKILFHSRQPTGKIGVWLTDRQGAKAERLTDGDQAQWSVDGKRVVFRRNGGIIEKELASGNERVIISNELHHFGFASYFPDGRIIFVEKNEKIFSVEPGGESNLQLLAEGEITSTPKCSPDGKNLAYSDGANIYLMDVMEKKITQLTTAGGVQAWPMWSTDSRSICYCQSSEAFAGPWDIYHVELENPQTVGLVMRDKDVSPDWGGLSPLTNLKAQVKGGNIDLRQTEDEVAVENDWLVFSVSSKENNIFLIPKKEKNSGSRIFLVLSDRQDKVAAKIKSVKVLKNDGENVALKVSFRSENRKVMETVFRVPRSSPTVEIEPVKNMSKVSLRTSISLAVLPDRFANDLIFQPDKYPASTIRLAKTAFLLGCLPQDGSMIMVITPSDKQTITLVKGGKKDSFEAIETLTEKKKIFISVLPHPGLWRLAEIKRNFDTDKYETQWSAPFHALWRLAVTTKEKNYSAMWDEKSLDELGQPCFAIEKFSKPPQSAVLYAYGRDLHTPLDILTPMDILRDALSMEKYKNILDIEGIRTYRTAEEWVPFLNLFFNEKRQSGILEVFAGVFPAGTEGVKSVATHLGNDVLNLLRGLDSRINEYESFLLELKNFCQLNKKENVAGLLNSIAERAEDLQEMCANLPLTEIEEVSNAIDVVKRIFDTGEGRGSGNKEFEDFSKISKIALSERQKVLTEYRDFIKKIRDEAGFIVAEESRLKDVGEDIRRLTQNILRKRYYLEGDWRGEKPLKGDLK